MKRTYFWVGMVVCMLVFSPFITYGQGSEVPVPDAINNFIDTLGQIDIDTGDAGRGEDALAIGESLLGEGGIDLSFIKDLWERANNWMSSNVGVSILEIFRAVANLLIWVFELAVKLIKEGLNAIPV